MCYDKSIDVLCPLVLASISFWAKEGGKGRGKKGERGVGGEGREGGRRREGGERREGERGGRGREEGGGERKAKGTQWQKQCCTVQLFDAPMIKVSFVFRES